MQEKCLYWALFLFTHFQLIHMICFFPVSANKSSVFLRYTVYQIDYALEEVDVGDWMYNKEGAGGIYKGIPLSWEKGIIMIPCSAKRYLCPHFCTFNIHDFNFL